MSDAIKRALVDELERSLVEFAAFVRDLPPDLYHVPVPGEEGSIGAILGHVVSAGYGHVTYVAENCGGKVPERRFSDPDGLTDAETYTAALLDVVRFAREALEPVTDHALEKRFDTRWGQNYDGEQMMEHASCHPGRHIRQLRRFLDGELGDPLVIG
ncbi:MAG TPA: DinB family protein [bacterium]|nr:DinB family protein [bacterium]